MMLGPGPTAGGGATWGANLSSARAQVATANEDPIPLHTNFDGTTGIPVMDPRFSFGKPVSALFDAFFHISYLTAAVEGRRYIRPRDSGTPTALILSLQTDGPLSVGLDKTSLPGFAWEIHAGLTAQPTLDKTWQILTGVGFSLGSRRHGFGLSNTSLARPGFGDTSPPEMRVLRNEVRAEALLGVAAWAGDNTRLSIGLQPYVVIHHWKPTGACHSCASVPELISFHNQFGVSVTTTLFFGGTRPR